MRLKTGLGILALVGTLVVSPVFAAELKIGVVDYGRLVEESPQAKSALESIRTEFTPRQRDLQGMNFPTQLSPCGRLGRAGVQAATRRPRLTG